MKKTRSRDHWVREPLIHRVCEEPEDPGSYPSWGLSLDLVSLRSLVKMGQHGDHCCPALLLDSLHIHTTASRLRQGQGTFSMAHSAGRVSDNLHPRVHRLTHHSQVPVHDRAIHNSLNGQNLKTKKKFSQTTFWKVKQFCFGLRMLLNWKGACLVCIQPWVPSRAG